MKPTALASSLTLGGAVGDLFLELSVGPAVLLIGGVLPLLEQVQRLLLRVEVGVVLGAQLARRLEVAERVELLLRRVDELAGLIGGLGGVRRRRLLDLLEVLLLGAAELVAAGDQLLSIDRSAPSPAAREDRESGEAKD